MNAEALVPVPVVFSSFLRSKQSGSKGLQNIQPQLERQIM